MNALTTNSRQNKSPFRSLIISITDNIFKEVRLKQNSLTADISNGCGRYRVSRTNNNPDRKVGGVDCNCSK